MNPKELRYDQEHEWVRMEGDTAVIGISDFAQDQLGEVVYLDIQVGAGDEVAAGDTFGEIESVKSVSELYVPVSGVVVEVNEALTEAPESVNAEPYGDGWMLKIRVADPASVDGLMTADEYEAFTKKED